jgi:hypothetical protein
VAAALGQHRAKFLPLTEAILPLEREDIGFTS